MRETAPHKFTKGGETMEKSIKEMIKESKERDAKRVKQLHEKIKAKFPGLEIKNLKTGGSLYGEYIVYLNERECIKVDSFMVYKSTTDLGFNIKYAEERGEQYEVVETKNYIYVIESCFDWQVWIIKFFKGTGKHVKGTQISRKVYTTGKGSYINLEGKRHYVSFLNIDDAKNA
jgi:hypothetical protein